MALYIEYTEAQKKAVSQLRRALNKCKKSGLGWFNEYGTLLFYPLSDVLEIDDNPEDGERTHDIRFEDLSLDAGEWSDDAHYAHFTDKGKAKYE